MFADMFLRRPVAVGQRCFKEKAKDSVFRFLRARKVFRPKEKLDRSN